MRLTDARRSGLVASAFVVISLLAMLLLPAAVERSGEQAREEVDAAADPARTLVTQIQYLLASQMSALRGYAFTGDTTYLTRYRSRESTEKELYGELRPLVARLGPQTEEGWIVLRTLSAEWHASVREEVESAARPRPGERPYDESLYLAAQAAATRLDRSIVLASAERRHRIGMLERRSNWLQGVLAVLGLAAALAAGGLGLRIHALAAEAEVRRREAERALADTARAIESKTRLIRGVTHDVKNPLGAADAYADLLALGLRGELSEPQGAMVAGIRRSIRHALDILQDLLDLSRAEAGALSVERELTSLPLLVREVVDDYLGAAETKHQSLDVRAPAGRVMVFTDEARVRQVLGNLISNAIKYTPDGGTIAIEILPGAEGDVPRAGHWVAVRVIDDGPGIHPDDQERIFEEFERLPGTDSDGHGLGLTISRRIARLLGGDVTVASETGSGSVFTLWLPVRAEKSTER